MENLKIQFLPKPYNEYDPNAITVINQKGKKIGYVPKAANKLMLYELKTESLYGIIFKADTEPDIRISAEVWASVRE